MVAMIWTTWGVDRYLAVVHSKAMALGVTIGEETSLEHLVGRKLGCRTRSS
jgi:hypothetical protein